ncbi:MAG: carboxypeptidase regulatory-like domain-containing protein, partial [Thermoplasmata archaeon]|nr:carboxypeptidase regulatory-like domain-containing protein [Thermoplasmata archaeon]
GNDGIDVILMSVGTEDSSDGSDQVSLAVNDTVENGLVVIAAMGNSNNTVVPSPAAADLAIAVGGTTDRDTVDRDHDAPWQEDAATGTNRGPRLDDGDDDPYDELKPDVVAPAYQIRSATGGPSYGPPLYVSTNQTHDESGTSAAAAHVAGIVALMLEANPDLRPEGDYHPIREILRATAESRGDAYDTNLSAKYNATWGYGLVDAYGAVVRAEDLASSALALPLEVDSGYKTTFSGKIRATSTEHTGREMVQFNFTMHRGWNDVTSESNVSVSIDGIKVLAANGSNDQAGMDIVERPSTHGRWVIGGWANLTGDPGRHWVNVTLKMAAPLVGSVEATRHFLPEFNIMYGNNYSAAIARNITVRTRWGSVGGKVTDDATGDPLDAVRVRLTIEDTSTVVNETYTGPDGAYLLVNLTEDYYDMEFFGAGYIKDDSSIARVRVQAAVLNDGNDVALVRESDEGFIEGVVRNGTGGGLSGATVTVLDGTSEVNETVSGSSGSYRVRAPAGNYDVRFELDGYDSETVGPIDVDTGQVTWLNVTLEEDAGQGSVRGTVRDDQGDPLADADVRAYIGTTAIATSTTGSNGRYIMSLDAGTYRVRCVHPDYQANEVDGVEVAAGEETVVDFDLEPDSENGWLYGTVSEFGTGTPLGGATVLATSGKKDSDDTTAMNGTYRILLEPDYYNVVVSLDGYEQKLAATSIQIVAGEGRLLDVELVRENDAPEVLDVSISPSTVEPDGATLFLVTASVDDPDGLEDIDLVTADLSALGGLATQRLYDTGTHGDLSADDGVFSYESTVAIGTPEGSYTVEVTAMDDAGETAIDSATMTVKKAGDGDGDGSPGFEGIALAAAGIVAIAAFTARKRFK